MCIKDTSGLGAPYTAGVFLWVELRVTYIKNLPHPNNNWKGKVDFFIDS